MSSASSSPPPGAVDAGQERVMAAANHIVKSLGMSKNAADDMMRFLSTYDPRLVPLSSPETDDDEEERASGSGEEADDEELITSAEAVIRRCNSSSPSAAGVIDDDYLYAVDDAIAAAAHSARAAAAVHTAMPRLEEEVHALLCSSPSPSSSDDLVAGDTTTSPPRHEETATLSPDAAAAAAAVAGRMLRAGYGPELAQAYVSSRRAALAEAVVGAEAAVVSIEEVLKMEWAALDQKMRRWAHAIGPVVRTHLAFERRLCDEVFEADEDLGHECFTDVARGCLLQLLGFPCAVAMSARAPEKLFRVVGMYEALADVQPDLASLFAGGADEEFFSGEVSNAVAQLAHTVRATVEAFGHVIRGEASRRPVHGGEIHPMTRYVLNYCGLLADSCDTLDAVLLVADDDDDQVNANSASSTPSTRCMRRLLTLLLRKMEEKSRLYDDAGLQNIFLMNNLYYVVQKVMDSPPLRQLLGDDWLRRHRGQIRQYEAGYLRASWIAVLSGLRDDAPRGNAHANRDRAVRDQARAFNAAFEEMYRAQTAWKVADEQLREELRIAVSERLIPAYRSFLARASRVSGRHVRYYSLEDLENYMLDFFEGVPKCVRC